LSLSCPVIEKVFAILSHKRVAQAVCENYQKEALMGFLMEEPWESRSPMRNDILGEFAISFEAGNIHVALRVVKTRSNPQQMAQGCAKPLRKRYDANRVEYSTWNSGVSTWEIGTNLAAFCLT
jgi:hypothetical protein